MRKLLSVIPLSALAFVSVDINAVSVKELTTLKNIGKKKAETIIAYRNMYCFKSLDEMTKVKRIDKELLQKNKNEITVGKGKTR